MSDGTDRDARPPRCAVASAGAGEDLIGTAGTVDTYILIACEPPWAPLPAIIPMSAWRHRAEAWPRHKVSILTTAPAPVDRPGIEVTCYRRRAGAQLAPYQVETYLLLASELEDFIATIINDGETVPAGDARESIAGVRHLLVCTQGSVDVCCGKLGIPAYDELNALAVCDGGTRVLRASHFGGHRFAPTVLELPDSRYWGRLDRVAMRDLVGGGHLSPHLYSCYRGNASLATAWEQVLERELFARYGSRWASFTKMSRVVASGSGRDALVRIEWAAADGTLEGSCEARIEISGSLSLRGCDLDGTQEFPQYRLAATSPVAETVRR